MAETYKYKGHTIGVDAVLEASNPDRWKPVISIDRARHVPPWGNYRSRLFLTKAEAIEYGKKAGESLIDHPSVVVQGGAGIMTVKELRDELAQHPDDTKVVAYWEDGSPNQYFGIDDVSLATGTPSRDSSGKPRFKFESGGPATWLFITISPD